MNEAGLVFKTDPSHPHKRQNISCRPRTRCLGGTTAASSAKSKTKQLTESCGMTENNFPLLNFGSELLTGGGLCHFFGRQRRTTHSVAVLLCIVRVFILTKLRILILMLVHLHATRNQAVSCSSPVRGCSFTHLGRLPVHERCLNTKCLTKG
jgi:hypothetical protein